MTNVPVIGAAIVVVECNLKLCFLPSNKIYSFIKKRRMIIYMIPEICKGMESNLIDPEEVQHCLRGSRKDRQVIQPVKNTE